MTYLQRLNEALQEHPEFINGMSFDRVEPGSDIFRISDPRNNPFTRTYVPDREVGDPFYDTIQIVNSEFRADQ